MGTNGERFKNGSAVVFEWVWRIATVLILPAAIWLAMALQSLDRRVIAIESSRFTAQDGLSTWRALEQRPTRDELRSDLAQIQERLNRIEDKLDR